MKNVMYIMIAVACFFLYLAIAKEFEPLLLVPIAFGMLLVNLYPPIMDAPTTQIIEKAIYDASHGGEAQNYAITVINGIIMQGILLFISTDIKKYLLAFIIGIIVPYIIAKTTKGLGEGDIGLYGLCCFALGENYSLYLIALSFILASVYCIYILLVKSDKIRKIPFAPFISLATVLIILTNFDILNFWFDIISN